MGESECVMKKVREFAMEEVCDDAGITAGRRKFIIYCFTFHRLSGYQS